MAEAQKPVFKLCECGKHGRIEYGDGRIDIECYSVKFAVISLGIATCAGRIAAGDALEVERQIFNFRTSLNGDKEDIAAVTNEIWDWNEHLAQLKCVSAPPPCFLLQLAVMS